jgi:lysophospholipase L1-like esterase
MRRVLLLLIGVMNVIFSFTYGQTRLVVLGSSTSAGTGASVPDSAWVNRFQAEYAKNRSDNQDTTVINLAVGGYVTYKIMPNDYVTPAGKPLTDTAHNVTKALSFAPSIIIINLPTNDVGNGYSRAEFIGNLRYLYQYIQSAGVKPYITTTQPRSQYDSNYRSILHDMVDSIMTSFGSNAIDFWNNIATTDSLYNIKPELNSGDGVHLNDKGHGLLFDKVKAKNVFGTAPSINPVNIHIEAERWSAMSGVSTENTTDVGGTQDVGWIDQNDWMDYTVNVPAAGAYTINVRLASPYNSAQFQVKTASTLLSTISVPNTGGWQVWQTISKTITLAAGTQTIRLISTSGLGWNINWLEITSASTVPVNQSPSANAGADKTITLPTNSVTLTGSGSDPDGTIASYAWTKVSGGAATINSPSAASTTVSGLAQGSYIFRLTVTDNNGATASDDVTVTVNGAANQSPSANAGADQTITLPTSSVTLTGSGSDPDGTIASYAWTKVSGGAATINSPSSASTTISGLAQGSYIFRLTVTDNGGATASDDVTVTVNGSSGGGSSRIEAENWSAMSGVLTENCSDVGGTLDVGWIDQNDWMDYTVNVPTAGSYTINLRIATPYTGAQLQIKNSGGSVLATVNVLTTGGFQSWQTTTATISLAAGTQTIRLQSTSGAGWNINCLEIAGASAANQSPSANAGADQTITLPVNSIILWGTGTDKDGTIINYTWSKVSGGTATIASANTASTTISGLSQGSYTFRLTVTDNNGATGSDEVMITVNAQPAQGNTTHIEAEKWSAMSGVMTENCSDAGGTMDVGWIDQNDWMEYTVSVPTAGSYTINLRLATPNTGAQFQIKNSTGTILTAVSVPITGAWQQWQTITKTINLSAGTQTIRLFSTSGAGWNINWLDIIGSTLNLARQSKGAAIEEIATAPSLYLFPNPVTSQGTIRISNPYDGTVKLYLYNVNGALVQQMEVQKHRSSITATIPFINLANGSYILKAGMKEWNSQVQLVKQ